MTKLVDLYHGLVWRRLWCHVPADRPSNDNGRER